MEKIIVKKTKEDFQKVISECATAPEMIGAIHRLVVPDFDKRECLNDYVRCNEKTANEISEMMLKIDRSIQATMVIVNYGFSIRENTCNDWEFDITKI